jgi:hypothetical protein
MSYDSQKDWQTYRGIMAEYCEYMLRFFPETSKEKWIVSCYQSFDKFIYSFPSAKSRDYVLKNLEEVSKRIKDTIESCRPIFDAMPVENQA